MAKVLITGGTGTLGKALAKRLARQSLVEKIVLFSRSEAEQVKAKTEIELDIDKIEFYTGSITNRDALTNVIQKYEIDTIAHTAALKHVPICEQQPSEAFETNVAGSRNVLQAASENDVRRVVLVSTDKASSPGNVYGLSKALMERLMSEYDGLHGLTVNVTRFGNLVGSRGSVLELFARQIRTKNVITVTDLKMTRFFMRISQAAEVVDFAMSCPEHGYVLVPKMGATTLRNFVDAICEYLNARPEVKTIGPRLGEKRHESVIVGDELLKTVLVPEFHGFGIGSKLIQDEDKRVLKKPYSSETSGIMDTEELVGMMRELGPKEDMMKV